MTLKAADDYAAIASRLKELEGTPTPAAAPVAAQPAPTPAAGPTQASYEQDEHDAWDNWASCLRPTSSPRVWTF